MISFAIFIVDKLLLIMITAVRGQHCLLLYKFYLELFSPVWLYTPVHCMF